MSSNEYNLHGPLLYRSDHYISKDMNLFQIIIQSLECC